MAISLLPILWELELPLYIHQKLTEGLSPKELAAMTSTSRTPDLARPWDKYCTWKESEIQESHEDTKKDLKDFENRLEMRHFALEEVSVKTADGFVNVEDFYEEKRNDHELKPRQFLKLDALPEGCNEEAVKLSLSPDVTLTAFASVDGKVRDVPRILQRQADDLHETGDKKKETQEEDGIEKEVEGEVVYEEEPEEKDENEEEPEDKKDAENSSQ